MRGTCPFNIGEIMNSSKMAVKHWLNRELFNLKRLKIVSYQQIMNKGPPAGNIIRKQVSLLPKYQITATPVDSRTLTIKLILLNQSYLSENLENLTAGESHKSYILVGDSQNYLLHISSFKLV